MLLPVGHMPLEPALNPGGRHRLHNYVAEQMEKGVACGVTKDFTYGANVPYVVLVDKDFLSAPGPLRQFIGRVARTGLAPYGVAQFEDDSLARCAARPTIRRPRMEATARRSSPRRPRSRRRR